MTSTIDLAHRFSDDLRALRREFHQIPELGLRLPLTKAKVLEALAGLPIEIHQSDTLDAVVGVIRGGKRSDGPVVLLRGDMDALPVQELTDLDYASTHPGVMHACGHDLHIAGLVGAARILCELREELAGDVVLMFQPAEEGPGGAEPMLAEGLLDVAGRPVEAAYALHVAAAEVPAGTWTGNRGATMAAAEDVLIKVEGAGGHGSQPWDAIDPVPIACEIALAIQTLVTRRFSPFDPVVAAVGRVAAGTKSNIIPDFAELDVTLRTLSQENRVSLREKVIQLAEGIASAHGLTATARVVESYPPTINDATEFDRAVQALTDLFGPEAYSERPNPEMGAEDFSFVLEQVPGAYLFLGACPGDPETAPDNHSPRAAFDDQYLWQASAWLAEMALRRCAV
ncbi:M20 metallopeptidase family protein [Calidifontibacter terrae]